MKSNLPRSAVWAKRANESNSMWLPAAGSLHTVVLFTPGEVRGQVNLLGHGSPVLRPSGGGVAVGGAAQAEQPPEGARLVAGTEQAAALQLGNQALADIGQVVRQCGR